ncbi:MAG: DNA-deoxyinosine glycosylase [Eubacteriaceae bacterium]|jgi:hypoxanthine-DNA glycosylase|nr:DNA-deoxyinosine glycosylase [Eubacteriaceae bacterium]
MNREYTHAEHGFGPVYNEKSRVLILGSFPSVKSRETGFYYGHLRNRFWEILALVTGDHVPDSVAGKREYLLDHGIALYDVIESCDVIGSSDSSIRNVVPADLRSIIMSSEVTAVFTNGALAEKYYVKYQEAETKITAVCLPSTSPANAAYNIERLYEKWNIVSEHLHRKEEEK